MKVKKLQTKMAILGAVLALAGLQVMAQADVFLIIDEDSIDNGTNCSDVSDDVSDSCVSIEECADDSCCNPLEDFPPGCDDPAFLVNDDRSSIPGVTGGCQEILKINTFAGLGGVPILTLPTGEVGDEGLFLPDPTAFDGFPGKRAAYINCTGTDGPPYSGDHVPVQDEHYLDGLAGTPLSNYATIHALLEEQVVCAVVHDSDVSNLGDEDEDDMIPGPLKLNGVKQPFFCNFL